jgi:hypothetical protein
MFLKCKKKRKYKKKERRGTNLRFRSFRTVCSAWSVWTGSAFILVHCFFLFFFCLSLAGSGGFLWFFILSRIFFCFSFFFLAMIQNEGLATQWWVPLIFFYFYIHCSLFLFCFCFFLFMIWFKMEYFFYSLISNRSVKKRFWNSKIMQNFQNKA